MAILGELPRASGRYDGHTQNSTSIINASREDLFDEFLVRLLTRVDKTDSFGCEWARRRMGCHRTASQDGGVRVVNSELGTKVHGSEG